MKCNTLINQKKFLNKCHSCLTPFIPQAAQRRFGAVSATADVQGRTNSMSITVPVLYVSLPFI